MKKYDIGFIGCGNMGGSLLKAVVKAVDAENIAVCSRSKATADAKAEEFGVVSTTIEDIAENCSWIFFAVKPQTYPEVCGQIKDILIKRYDAKDRFVIVSMAASIPTTSADIEQSKLAIQALGFGISPDNINCLKKITY